MTTATKKLTGKAQLKIAFKMLLNNMVDVLNNNCSYAGSDEEASTIDCYVNLLLKEVSIRTTLK